MTQRCPADDCLSLHPSEHSLAMHLFKSDDSEHAEWGDYDDTLREVFNADYAFKGADGSARSDPEGEPTEEDGDDPEPSVDDDDTALEEPSPTPASTDGGPQSPPEPSIPEPELEPEPESTVPDHLVPVDEFVESAEEELPEDRVESEEWQEFADDLRDDPGGYVDAQASDLAAGEVTTTDA